MRGPDVGDAVALGVLASRSGVPGQVGAKAGALSPGRSPSTTRTHRAPSRCATSSPSATLAIVATTTGAMSQSASKGSKTSTSGTAWACTARADEPSASTTTRSWLPRREPTRKTDGGPEGRDDLAPAGHRDEILVAPQLRHCADHLRGQARGDSGQRGGVRLVGQQPIPQLPDRHRSQRRERLGVVPVDDQPRDIVILVGDHELLEESRQRYVGQRMPGRDPFSVRAGGDPGQNVTGLPGRRAGKQRPQVVEPVAMAADTGAADRHPHSTPETRSGSISGA